MTDDVFERHHLAYAVALDVAEAWEDKDEVQVPPEVRESHSISWRRGGRDAHAYRGIGSTLVSALTRTVASAARAPSKSSSSSSGGGGSSW